MKKIILIFTTLILFTSSFAQRGFKQIPDNTKRLALVIGNSAYQNGGYLRNPVNDARAMTTTLEKLNFTVLKYENLNQSQTKQRIDEFGAKMANYDVALFYYAGHGIQTNGLNYLVPVDASLTTEQQIEYQCVRADRMFGSIVGEKTHIIILDACRNNPFERSWGRNTSGSGLAFMQAPSNSFIAYATAPGQTASDGTGNNGLYTEILIQEMLIPNKTISQIFQSTRARVQNKSETELNKKQTPWESTSIIEDFYFLIDDTEIEPKPDPNPEDLQNQFTDKRDGKTYQTVKIGNQIWSAENLAYLPQVCPSSENCGYWVYDYQYTNVNSAKATANYQTYGVLYNWEVAINVCPSGWHLPSDAEWKQLEMYLGMSQTDANRNGWRGSVGNQLKATTGWKSNVSATNKSGFNALPGGRRNYTSGTFRVSRIYGYWWSATPSSGNSNAWYRELFSNGVQIERNNFNKAYGFSVRCVKD